MAQVVDSSLQEVMKEVFTDSTLEKQFYDEQDWLSRLQRTSDFTIGRKATVPLHKGRSGGYTVGTPGSVAALNGADKQRVDHAEYTIPDHYFETEVELAAWNQAAGGDYAACEAVALEIRGAVQDLRNQIEVQFLGNGDGFIAQCTTTSNSTEVELLATGYGYDAIVRGWLYEGLPVDIGTTSDEDTIVASSSITAVEESSSTPSITIGTAVTTSSSHYVSVANSRSGSTSKVANGLRTIAGSTSSAIGGLDPDTAGEGFWKPAKVETETTLTLAGLLGMQRATHQKTGKKSSLVLTSLKQQQALYELLQSQVRFQGDVTQAGNVSKVSWNGNEIEAIPAVPDRELYVLNPEDMLLITGAKVKRPTWVSSIGNAAKAGFNPRQGYNSVWDTLYYPIQLGIRRRNGFAANISLTD